MAIKVSDIYCQYHEQHRLSEDQCKLMEEMNTYVRSVEDSKALSELVTPHIIIAGSGMATGGRILHHMKRLLGNDKTTLLFSGFLAGGTRGAKLIRGEKTVKIHGQWLPVNAKVEVIDGLSGHADYVEITQWLQSSPNNKNLPIRLVHGDADALEGMSDYLKQNSEYDVEIASYKSILRL
jgi:metallo-beta-lactamase family protein